MRKDTSRFNNDMNLKPVEVFLVNGTSFIGVRLGVLSEGGVYQVDSEALQRTVPEEDIAYTRDAAIPGVRQTTVEKAGAGMLGKHHRVLYHSLSPTEQFGDAWVTAMGVLRSPPTIENLRALLSRVWDGLTARPPEPAGLHLRVPSDLWLDTLHLLDAGHATYHLDLTQTHTVQVSFEKFDRRNEQFRVHEHLHDDLGLDDLSDPSKVGPAWRSQTRKFFGDEMPGSWGEVRAYTWEQLARALLDIQLGHHKSILPVLNHPLLLPKPLSTYFQQRVRKAMDPNSADPKLDPSGCTHSQPQLSRPQLEQLYMASYWVHRFARGTRLPLQPRDRRAIEASKIVLMCYKMRGFFCRETRNYQQTGANSFIHNNAGRRWKEPVLRALYDRDTGGEGMVKLDGDRVNTNELPYRGKFGRRQPPERAIYRPNKKRRNVDREDNDVQMVEEDRRKRMLGVPGGWPD